MALIRPGLNIEAMRLVPRRYNARLSLDGVLEMIGVGEAGLGMSDTRSRATEIANAGRIAAGLMRILSKKNRMGLTQ